MIFAWVSSVCVGREEEAKITTIAAPGKESDPIDVLLKKQGLVDMDYDVIDMASDQTWMLIDTVFTFTGNRKCLKKANAATIL